MEEKIYPSEATEHIQPFSWNSILSFFSFFVRALGVVIMLVGLWMGVKLANECWDLYRNPQKISEFANIVDKESGLNRFAENLPIQNQAASKVNVSYFVAWVIAIMLLFLIGRICLWAIAEGGKLALYNADTERIAKAMVKQIIQEMQIGRAHV